MLLQNLYPLLLASLVGAAPTPVKIERRSTSVASIVPTIIPTSIPQALSLISKAYEAAPTNPAVFVPELISSGLILAGVDENTIGGPTDAAASSNNINLRSPAKPVYPQKEAGDAPYSVTENALRSAIYIPSSFTYGKKPPIILVPGTGNFGYVTYQYNYIPLLAGTPYADAVWLNIPGALLGDAQVNAEYVAYAINYISGISSYNNVSVMAWSQGNLDAQWAFKYWPSTRKITSDLISFSPDFHGTIIADVTVIGTPQDPADLQQSYDANFITTLRSNGGDSAYVPTTTIYSGTDEIVQPQQGVIASAYLKNAHGAGVTNNYLQGICPGRPAGGVYTHEGLLYNPIAYALAIDALTHAGPGMTSRINLAVQCQLLVTPGLTLLDVEGTESCVVNSAINGEVYEPKVTKEPPIMAYAA